MVREYDIQGTRGLAASIEQIARESGPAELLYDIVVPAPVRSVASFPGLDGDADAVVWIPPDESIGGDRRGWSIVGLGTALRLTARGAMRFSALKRDSRLISNHGSDVVSNCPARLPGLRFFGGGAFVPGGGHGKRWEGFGDGDFMIPQWQYGTDGREGFVRLCVSPQLLAEGTWRPMADCIDSWMASNAECDQSEGALPIQWRVVEADSHDVFVRWQAKVLAALGSIAMGRLDKVVVSRPVTVVSDRLVNPSEVVARMDGVSTCARFLFRRQGRFFVGITPEQLVEVRDQGLRVATDVLAGSAARRTRGRDVGTVTMLLNSDKNLREFAFVHRFVEARLRANGVTLTGDTEVSVRSLADVHHLASRLEGTVLEPVHVLDLVAALHPTPAVCGTPVVQALKWIDRHEGYRRGWYAGPVGWFDAAGDGSFFVGIRSAVVEGRQGWVFSGAGVVAGSDPREEFRETEVKQQVMLRALGAVL